MFIFTLSSFWDRYDPYWYGRLMGLKLSFIAIVLFMVNAFLKSPFSPVLIMLVAAAGVLLIEMPAINTLKKKDTVYLIFLMLTLITIVIFNVMSYLTLGFLIVAPLWVYVLYSFLSRQPGMIEVVSLIVLLALMSLEGQAATEPYAVFNLILFMLEFSLCAFWAHKLFPFIYLNIYLSASLRSLEAMAQMLDKRSFTAVDNLKQMRHLMVLKNSLSLFETRSYQYLLDEMSKALVWFQADMHDLILSGDLTDDKRQRLMLFIKDLIEEIKSRCPLSSSISEHEDSSELALQHAWRELCKRS
ncbi:MAG: hypothetical protein ACO2ZM_07415 [Francisellaceae bacterium]